MIEKVISGHQTGVDRGGIDAARSLRIATGGWVPKGRRSEDGMVPSFYSVQETESWDYRDRTELNIRDSDATLIIKSGLVSPGTRYTIKTAQQLGKPCFIVDINQWSAFPVIDWLKENSVKTLNIAGPRESKVPGIQARSQEIVHGILGMYPYVVKESD